MVRVFVSVPLEAPISAVWAVVRRFDGVEWMPDVLTTPAPIEGGLPADAVGAVRQLVLKEGVLREELVAFDDSQMSFTYKILDGPLPVKNYEATLKVVSITATNQTLAIWEANFDSDGVPDEVSTSLIRDDVFATCLVTLNRQLKLSRRGSSAKTTRMLHTMIRVGDLQRSIDFYTKVMGMTFLRTSDQPHEEYTLAFLGFGAEDKNTVLELTYNYGKSSYEHGEAYGHICLAVVGGTMAAELERIRSHQVQIDYASDDGFMAFISDPDGYAIELLDEDLFAKQWSRGQ
jgi:lactoylglutathione lyase